MSRLCSWNLTELSSLMACGKKLLLSLAPHAAVALTGWREGEQVMCLVGGVFDDIHGSLAWV